MKKSLLLIVLIPAIIFIGFRWNSAPFFSAHQSHCVFDTFISDEYASTINSVVTELLRNNISTYEIIKQLQQQFSFLKKITVAYQPLAVRITLSAHKPIYCVNNVCVLTAQKEVFSKNVFSDKALSTIADIMVAHEDMIHMPYYLSELLQVLPAAIYHEYNVTLLNEHCVHLSDKKQPNFTIISSIAQQKLSTLLPHCDAVKHTLGVRGEFDKGIKWIADTRFAHYIVAYRA